MNHTYATLTQGKAVLIPSLTRPYLGICLSLNVSLHSLEDFDIGRKLDPAKRASIGYASRVITFNARGGRLGRASQGESS